MLFGAVGAVETILTVTEFGALLTDIVALAVFFLALCTLAVASFDYGASQRIVKGTFVALLCCFLGLLNGMDLL